jgi:hypothetical protein
LLNKKDSANKAIEHIITRKMQRASDKSKDLNKSENLHNATIKAKKSDASALPSDECIFFLISSLSLK